MYNFLKLVFLVNVLVRLDYNCYVSFNLSNTFYNNWDPVYLVIVMTSYNTFCILIIVYRVIIADIYYDTMLANE